MIATPVKPTVAFVMDAPLQQLVDELHVILDESSSTDMTADVNEGHRNQADEALRRVRGGVA
ncbi:hypothetical protein ACFXKC_30215 [Streptomyces sp. NPDC059340]|uniref:hypothetical protein n=1 Tax=Streptomyces sp. NPDC059340 TaxID=3346806 RepID=UPI0036A7788E